MMQLIAKLRQNQRGTSLLEFAIVLPVLLVMFLGGYQLSDAMACKRRVTIMTRAMADITSQYRSMTEAQMTSILAASTQIMAPYSTAKAQVRISQVTVHPSGLIFKIDWSRGRNVAPREQDKWYLITGLPAAFRKPDSSFIYAESSYSYDAALDTYFSATTFAQSIWMLPRRSPSVTIS